MHIVWDFYPAYIVVDVTMAMAEYGSQRSDQPENVNFEPIIRGLKVIFFLGPSVNSISYMLDSIAKVNNG